jgi:hypothetical protein
LRDTTRSAINTTAAKIVTTVRDEDFGLLGCDFAAGAGVETFASAGSEEMRFVVRDTERVGTGGTLYDAEAFLVVRFAVFLTAAFFTAFLAVAFFAVDFFTTFLAGFFAAFFTAFFAATNFSYK